MKQWNLWMGLVMGGLALVCAGTGLAEGGKQEAPMVIMPAPAKVVIDGDLSDWDKSGKIGPATFDEEVKDEYNGTFYAMYDQDNLYLAAVIVEPHLPYNTFPTKGIGCWNGDCVILRLTTNPKLGVPPQSPDLEKTTDLWQGGLWWNHVKKETFWEGYFGMGGKATTMKDMVGVQAVTKIAKDGKGYTMEIKMPWAFLNPKFQPKPGDEIALTWEISVSGDNPVEPGRAFQIFANGGSANSFRSPSDWGKAIFK